ncbi:hypothetical protein DMENIID0001_011530 [Sergentomyia squamirostris]
MKGTSDVKHFLGCNKIILEIYKLTPPSSGRLIPACSNSCCLNITIYCNNVFEEVRDDKEDNGDNMRKRKIQVKRIGEQDWCSIAQKSAGQEGVERGIN